MPLVWLLERMEGVGLVLPDGWRARFPADAGGPSVGTWRRFGPLFWTRKRRLIGRDASERVHPSAVGVVPEGVELGVWGVVEDGAAAE